MPACPVLINTSFLLLLFWFLSIDQASENHNPISSTTPASNFHYLNHYFFIYSLSPAWLFSFLCSLKLTRWEGKLASMVIDSWNAMNSFCKMISFPLIIKKDISSLLPVLLEPIGTEGHQNWLFINRDFDMLFFTLTIIDFSQWSGKIFCKSF